MGNKKSAKMIRLIYSNCLLWKAECFSVLNSDQCYYSGNNICQSRHSGESRNPELAGMPDPSSRTPIRHRLFLFHLTL